MPVSLLPVSRRGFLAGSMAGAAALLLGRGGLWAAETNLPDPHRVALLSDIHIATDLKKVERNVNMAEHLQSAVGEVAKLLRNAGGPATAFINGDCAHHTGELGDYSNVVNLLGPLTDAGLPIHLSMGNHDRRDHLWKTLPWEKWGGGGRVKAIDSRHVLIVSTPRAEWIVLDSLDKTNQTPGVLGEEQLAWLKGALDAPGMAQKNVLVMVHHHPQGFQPSEMVSAPASMPASGTMPGTTQPAATQPRKISGMVDTEALLDLLLPRKQVKALLFGHTHIWKIKERDGMHLINLPAVAYPFKAVEATGWVDCRLGEDGMKLELRCIDPKHPKHGEVAELKWRG